MSSQKILKEIIITSILCQSWEVIFCSSINCTRKTIFSLLVNSPNMQARPPFNDTCYMSGYQQIIMPLIAEKFASDVAGCSPRSTNLVLMLWPQEQKGKHIKSIWQCWQQQDFFAQLKWLLTSNLLSFPSSGLQNGGRQERKKLGSWLQWQELVIVASGNCLALLTRNKELG